MSQPDDEIRERLRERLLEQALGEVLGGETPPDLSGKILAAAEKQETVSVQRKEPVMGNSRRSRRFLAFSAVAACLVCAVSVAVLQQTRSAREARQVARQSAAEMSRSPRLLGPSSMPYETAEAGAAAAPWAERPAVGLDTDALGEPTAAVAFSADGKIATWSRAEQKLRTRRYSREDQTLSEAETSTPEAAPTGRGPGMGGDRYDRVVENPFRAVKENPLSTFSIDVDTASYANLRRFLLQEGRLPPPDAVRIEELINYFDYDYSGPTDDVPFAAHIEVAGCPWQADHRLVRIGLKGREIKNQQRPRSNLVFLLDVSGSMDSPDKLPLLKQGMKMLAEQLGENDRVAIVVYAKRRGLVLPSTSGQERQKIIDAARAAAGRRIDQRRGGHRIGLPDRPGQLHQGGVNRVLLCTDGDFNVGTTSTGSLERMVEEKAKSGIFLSVLGFGRGNLNDAMMETISNKGNGNYAYIDGVTEAQKVLVEQMGGTLVTIAKDVKIQIEFNPAQVAAYRLIGYENRMLAAEDFNDDKKDAGEIGAGHTVTALYEIVPAGAKVDLPAVDPLKYQAPATPGGNQAASNELLTLKLRYKEPEEDSSKLLEFPVVDGKAPFGRASADFQFASAVASFGMLLRGSEHKGTGSYDAVLEIAESAKGADKHGYRAEFVEIVRRAQALAR